MANKTFKCNCESEFQDKTYGNGNRVHNFTAKNNNWRCTVCGSEKAAPKDTKEKVALTKNKK